MENHGDLLKRGIRVMERYSGFLFAGILLMSGSAIGQTQPGGASSIIPDMNDQGRRGDVARIMMEQAEDRFLRADLNRDYLISPEEARQELGHIGNNFSRYDKNRDGSVSWQEMLGHSKWPQPVHK